ncbi:MAG: hypothetical protein KatS3mg111_1611 [Pirellulaceae bacterium]|nr:MAG: hypothetical protein KatS3mg111_1611 [Pirellulaceae bacterium]
MVGIHCPSRDVVRHLTLEALEARRLLAFNPTAEQWELFQLVNRLRTDPAGEFDRLFTSASPLVARDASIQPDIDFAGVDGNLLRSELAALTPVPPLAWSPETASVAQAHNQQMIAAGAQFHSASMARRQALLDAGVNLRFANGELISSENVYGYGRSVFHTYAAYVVDWQAGQPGGMQPDRPHRRSIMQAVYDQIGHDLTRITATNFGPWVNTQVLVNIESPPAYVVGSVFEDGNASLWYEAGEGLAGVLLEFFNGTDTFTTITNAAGAYQLALPPGTYAVTAQGGPLAYSLHQPVVVVGEENVWLNWIYDPHAIAPDSHEPNDTLALATPVPEGLQSRTGSLHSPTDVDVFRIDTVSSGDLVVQAEFDPTEGDVDLYLRSATGSVLASSTGTSNHEKLAWAVNRDQRYYLEVRGKGGQTNPAFTLLVDSPLPQPPDAVADRRTVIASGGLAVLDLLSNDRDPDGDLAHGTVELVAPVPDNVTLTGQQQLQIVPAAAQRGPVRTTYRVVDDQGLYDEAVATFFVIDLQDSHPWRNEAQPADVDGDGIVAPIDALLVINELNRHGGRQLPLTPERVDEAFGFLDTNGDNYVAPVDALIVINHLNRSRAGGEGERQPMGAAGGADTDRRKESVPPVGEFAVSPLVDDPFLAPRRLRRGWGSGA